MWEERDRPSLARSGGSERLIFCPAENSPPGSAFCRELLGSPVLAGFCCAGS